MKPIQIAFYSIIAAIIFVTLLSGPLIPSINWTQETSSGNFPEGQADITVIDWPNKGSIEPLKFRSEEYKLTIDSAKIRATTVSGSPVVNYRLNIPKMNRSQVAVYTLTPSDEGSTLSLEIPQSQLESVPAVDELDAEVEVLVRNNSGKREIGSRNVTISVTQS